MIPREAEETGSELFDSPVLNPEVAGWGQVLSTPARPRKRDRRFTPINNQKQIKGLRVREGDVVPCRT